MDLKININKHNGLLNAFSMARMLLMLLAPLLYIYNVYFLILCIFLVAVLIAAEPGEFDGKAFAFLLFSFLFSGVLFFNVHFYDWALIIVALLIILFRKGRIEIPNYRMIILLLIALTLIFLESTSKDAVVDIVRYVSALFCFVVACNIRYFDKDYLCNRIVEFTIYAMYLAVMVFVLLQRGMFKNITNGIVTVDAYISGNETRLNGFFTDPNKYFAYILALVCILYFYNCEKKYLLLGMLASVLSLSRTAIISIVVFVGLLALKYVMEHMPKLSRIFFVIIVLLLMAGAVAFVFKSGFIEQVFQAVGRLLGRDATVSSTASLSQDNRIKSWRNVSKLIFQSPILGCGLDIIDNRDLLIYATHNTVLQLLAKGGIFLFGCYIAFFKKVFNKMNIAIAAFIIIPMLMLDMDTYRLYYIMYSLLFI